MTNVIHLNPKRKYDSLPERELESLWKNISGKDIRNLNRNLIKAIAKNEDKVQTIEIPLHAKQMFDSGKVEFVPFDIWGAHYIVNVKKETLVMRIYLPLPYQNEGREVLKAWTRYDCAHLQESLKDTKHPVNLDKHVGTPVRGSLKEAHKLRVWRENDNRKKEEAKEKLENYMNSLKSYNPTHAGDN